MDIRTRVSTNYGELPEKFKSAWDTQIAALKKKFGAAIGEVKTPQDSPTEVPVIFVNKDQIIDVLKFVKTEKGFEYDFLSDITATDEETQPRFTVVYNLFSVPHKYRIRFKCWVAEGEEVPTLTQVWAGADWAEREVWDMFGIRFKGHPDLRRILMDERWVGHPLRKDYPLRGYQIFPDAEVIDEAQLK